MSKDTCSIDDCGRSARARGWCIMHYNRWNRTGSTDDSQTLSARFAAHAIKSPDCWQWKGNKNFGYGMISVEGKNKHAHRVSCELHVGPIPPGMHIDHKCHNRECTNPRHLRLATPKQNFENRKGADADSRTGVRGVTRLPSGSWAVRIGHKGHKMHVGTYPTLAAAESAAIAKRNELFTHNILDRVAL